MVGSKEVSLRSEDRALDRREVKELFYKLYPDSDPKYYIYFMFGQNVDGGKLVSIDIYYTHNLKYNDYVQIIKGENDKDPK